MTTYLTTDTDLTSIANAIRTKGGTSAPLAYPLGFVSAINNIEGGGSGGGSTPVLQTVTLTLTPSETTQSQSITPGPGYDGLNKVDVTVNAISSTYVGSGISHNTSSNVSITNSTVNIPAGYYESEVNVDVPSSEGLAEDDTKVVKFLDYDGTIVAQYTKAEAANLTVLPACPQHDGLTSQGWNFTLAEVKTQASNLNCCIVGHNLVTTDGKTRIYIDLKNPKALSPYLSLGVKGTFTIDWGDGSSTSTLTGTSLTTRKNIQHVYSSIGEYVITLTPASGTKWAFITGSSYGSYLLNFNSNSLSSTNRSDIYSSTIQKIELGTGITTFANYSFRDCYYLETINIPNTITSIGTYCFSSCFNLKFATIPSGVTSIGSNTFAYCYHLRYMSLPASITSINQSGFAYCYVLKYINTNASITTLGPQSFQACQSLLEIYVPNVASITNTAFANCYCLSSIKIPSTVTSIGTTAFSACYGMTDYYIYPTSPPALTNSNSFANIQACAVMHVPASYLSTYQTASIWTNWSSKMVGDL